MAQSKAVDRPRGQTLTVEQVEDVLLHGGELDVVSPDDVQDDMVRQILASGSLDDAFGGFKATPASDLEGVRVIIDGVAWMRSAFDAGPKIYALLRGRIADSGMPVTISMGGRSLMASFVWAQRNEAMPLTGTFVRERSNTNTERAFWTFRLAEREV